MTQTEIIACFYIIAAAVVIMAVACLIQNRYEDKRLRADREAADAKAEDERIQNIMSQHKKPVGR
jgi:low affinity Fe/Cu permease